MSRFALLLVTAKGLSQPVSHFELTILDTFLGSFSEKNIPMFLYAIYKLLMNGITNFIINIYGESINEYIDYLLLIKTAQLYVTGLTSLLIKEDL